jgi:hypothetical protein
VFVNEVDKRGDDIVGFKEVMVAVVFSDGMVTVEVSQPDDVVGGVWENERSVVVQVVV